MHASIQWSGFIAIFLMVQMVQCEGLLRSSKFGRRSWRRAASVYDFTVNDIKGEPVPLEKYKGNVLLIVNVASKCGLANSNYPELVELDETYRDQGLRILAFPCNQFGNQEPGDAAEIMAFAKAKNANFDFFEKTNVNGRKANPLWIYLKAKKPGTFGEMIKWNFSKFLVDRNGQPVERFGPTLPTTNTQLLKQSIEALL